MPISRSSPPSGPPSDPPSDLPPGPLSERSVRFGKGRRVKSKERGLETAEIASAGKRFRAAVRGGGDGKKTAERGKDKGVGPAREAKTEGKKAAEHGEDKKVGLGKEVKTEEMKTEEKKADKGEEKKERHESSVLLRQGSEDLRPPLPSPGLAPSGVVSVGGSVTPPEATRYVDAVCKRVLLSRGDGAGDATLRLSLSDKFLPRTALRVSHGPDGGLRLDFETSSTQSRALLETIKADVSAHVERETGTRIEVRIEAVPEEGGDRGSGEEGEKERRPDWDRYKEESKR